MENQQAFIVLVLGDSETGKSTIIGRYIENKLVETTPTIGVEKRDSQLELATINKKAQIYDTSGKEKYRQQVCAEFKNASAIVLVYDITDYQSFQNIQTLHKEVNKQNPNINYWIVVGNKIDLKDQRKVHPDDGKRFASTIGARFLECSAKQPSNINLIFLTISQWTQINIQPKFVPEQTQRLLEKLNSEETQKQLQVSTSKTNQTKLRNRNTSFSLIQNNTNPIAGQSFEEQQHSFNGDSMEDYFSQMMKKQDQQSQQLADDIVQETKQNIISALQKQTITIQENKQQYFGEGEHTKLELKSEDKILLLQKKHKQLDKLRKEIAQNLLLVQEQKKKLTVDQVIENTQTTKLERELQKRLLSVEKNMDIIKTDIILSQKTQKFSTNKNNFISNDQSMILKQHISLILNPDHLKEQNEQINKIKIERKKLEQLRDNRNKTQLETIEALEKQEKEQRLKNEHDLIVKRKERALSHLASMDKIRQEKSDIISRQNEQIKRIIGTTPLHVQLEKTFQEKLINAQLEEHKQKLKQIRDLHKPLRLNELKEWEDNYEKRKKSQEELRSEKIRKTNLLSYQASFESQVYKQIKDEQIKNQKVKELTLKEKQQKEQAKQEFLSKLKEYHPSISPEKQQELEQMINKAHHKINFYEFIEMTKKVKQKAVFFDQDGKIIERSIDETYYEKIKENEKNEDQDGKQLGNQYLHEIRKFIKKPSTHEETTDKMKNQSNPEQAYQQVVRNPKKNKLNEIKSHWKLKPQITFEEGDLVKVIDGNEIRGFSSENVMKEASKLATEAIRKMQIIEARKHGQESFTEIQSADQLLINSIKAKLSVMEKELKTENKSQEGGLKLRRGRSQSKQHQ